jgi:sortase A
LLLAVIAVTGGLFIAINSYGHRNIARQPAINRKALPSPNAPTLVAGVGLPTRLTIKKLGIDAQVEYVGTTPAGAMDVPANVTEAGWYKYGAHPGDVGTAVIAGHLDGIHGEPGVFINLNRLKLGDEFSVVNDLGESVSFAVRQIKTYGQSQQPEEVFHSSQGVHLNLITCTGAWDRAEKRFSERLVVFGDRIN